MPRRTKKLANTVLDEKTGLHVLPSEYDRFHAGRRDPNYSNDRRAGRTKPGLIEIIPDTDPRHPRHPRYLSMPAPGWEPNRAQRRFHVHRHSGTFTTRRSSARRPDRTNKPIIQLVEQVDPSQDGMYVGG